MEYIAHDLLQLKEEAKLISYTPIPDWVEHSLAKAPFVVVRRAVHRDSLIPVGVREKEEISVLEHLYLSRPLNKELGRKISFLFFKTATLETCQP